MDTAMTDYENTIRNRTTEYCGAVNANGEMIFTKGGEIDRIDFTPNEMDTFKGATFTHNHPDGTAAPSIEDLLFACRTGMIEMRVVTPSGGTSVSRRESGKRFDESIWNDIFVQFHTHRAKVHDRIIDEIRDGHIRLSDANAQYLHEIWERIAENVQGLEYVWTARKICAAKL